MRRPRWHDLVLVLGVVAVLGVGVWALWGDDIRAWIFPPSTAPIIAPPTSGTT